MGNRRMIDEAFGREVQALLNDGYQFFTPSMAGHQLNEIAKADFLKGDHFVRVLLQDFFEQDVHEYHGYELVVGELGNCPAQKPCYESNHTYTIFNKDLFPRKAIKFYSLNYSSTRAGDSLGYGTKEQAHAAWKKNKCRIVKGGYKQHDFWKPRPEKMDEAKKILLPLFRRMPGLKSVNMRDIDDIVRGRDSNSSAPYWYCYIRGKRLDYHMSPSNFYYDGKHYTRGEDGNWIRIN